MDERSRFMGLGLGLYCIAVGPLLLVRPGFVREAAVGLARDPALLLMAGVLTLGLGIAWVLGHTRWRGGAAVVAVTLAGWLTLVKGLLLLAVPGERLAALYDGALAQPSVNGLATLVLGAWLCAMALRRAG